MPISETEAGWNAAMIADMRANEGRVTEGRLAGAHLLLLTTTGTRTGAPSTVPLGYTRDRGRWIVVGSNSGKDAMPAWVANVQARPEVTIEVRGSTFPALATIESGAERRRLLDAHIERLPIFARYESMTARQLPVVSLRRDLGRDAEPVADGWTAALLADLRANGGRPSSGPLAGQPLLVMRSLGAKSDDVRRSILTYSRDDGDYVVAGTAGGAPVDPKWVGNVRRSPDVSLEVDGDEFAAVATIVDGPERDRLWAQHVAALPWFGDYEAKAGRTIPMVRLRRA